MEKRLKRKQSGITLIALVVTIIVLLILVGVAINLTLGKNGLLNRTKEAREKYEIATAKEYIEIKINECILEKGGDASLQDIIDYLAEDSTVTYYVALEEVGLVAGEVDIGSPKEVYVVYNNYQFKVNESKKVEFISVVNVDLEGKVSIEAQVKEHLGKNADGNYTANVLLKATGDAEISKLEIQNPDGTTLSLEPDGLTTVGKDMTIEFDKTYKVILTTANGHKYTKKITEKSEETIMNAEQLASFRDKVNNGLTYEGKTVKLGADIDLSTVCGANVGGKEVSWEPIGTDTTIFKGTFDGGKHTIEEIYIDNLNLLCAGLFARNSGIIQELTIKNSKIEGKYYVGAICGYNAGTIRESIVESNVTIKGTGNNQYGTYVGGVVGTTGSGNRIIRCENKANVTGTNNYVGGIAGVGRGEINECFNSGVITGEKYFVGGIVGINYPNLEIKNCYNTESIIGEKYVGGIIGSTHEASSTSASIENSYNLGKVKATSQNAGGITGRITLTNTIKNTYNLKNVEASEYQGNTIGYYDSGSITNSFYIKGLAGNYAAGNRSTLIGIARKDTLDMQHVLNVLNTGNKEAVWEIVENQNNGYPILKWQLQENQVTE